MGYSTQFAGELLFTTEATASQLARLNQILGEDKRDHEDWPIEDGYWYHVDLELTKDFTGIKWDGMEKTGDMVAIVNTVLALMRQEWPDFGLSGRMDAQGEEVGDVWALVVEAGGVAQKIELLLEGRRVECPHCEEEFVLDAKVTEPPTP